MPISELEKVEGRKKKPVVKGKLRIDSEEEWVQMR